MALSACSLAGPAPHTFTTVQPTPAAASAEPAQAKSGKAKHHGKKKTDTEPAQSNPNATPLETTSDACKTAARDKGIKSVLAILSHMRPGAVDED